MLEKIRKFAATALSGLEKESHILQTLHHEVAGALARMTAADKGLRSVLDDAYAYAVFPAVGKAAAVVGAAFGKGEVFREDELIGYAAIAQLTLGVQLGGETFSEILVFGSKTSFDRFKAGRFAPAANASAVMVKAGAAAAAGSGKGAVAFVHAEGGMLLELAVGAQKFWFVPAVLGRGREPTEESTEASPAKRKRASGSRKQEPSRSRTRPGKSFTARPKHGTPARGRSS